MCTLIIYNNNIHISSCKGKSKFFFDLWFILWISCHMGFYFQEFSSWITFFLYEIVFRYVAIFSFNLKFFFSVSFSFHFLCSLILRLTMRVILIRFQESKKMKIFSIFSITYECSIVNSSELQMKSWKKNQVCEKLRSTIVFCGECLYWNLLYALI